MMTYLTFQKNGYIGATILFLVACLSTPALFASNESDAAKIQRAIRAAPSSITDQATIMDAVVTVEIVDNEEVNVITFVKLREDDEPNGWTCFPGLPVMPGDKHPMCNDAVWMDWLNSIITQGYPTQANAIGISYMLLGDAGEERSHLMMLLPGLPSYAYNPDAYDSFFTKTPYAGPYVMGWDGTYEGSLFAHIMVPLTDR